MLRGEKGILIVDRQGWEVLPETDRIDKSVREYKASGVPWQAYRPDRGNMHLDQVKNFLGRMRTRGRPRSDVEISHDSMIGCHLGNAAVRTGRRVYWDVENERVVDHPEAEAIMYKRPNRTLWKLEV